MRSPAIVLLAACAASACGGAAQSPSPVPTPPLSLSCPANVTVESGPGENVVVDFALPAVAGGRAPVTVTCAPTSGSAFPVGTSTVGCTAADAASQSAACSFQVRVTRTLALSVTRFLAFGDSITEGFLREPPAYQPGAVFPMLVIPSETYPFKLEKLLESDYPSQQFTVVNGGVGGETTTEGRARFLDALSSARPEVVLLLEGYNELTEISTGTAREDLRAMARSAQVRDVKVLLATLFHVTDFRERQRPGSNDAIRALNREIREIAAELTLGPVVDLDRAFGDPPDGSLFGSDGLHPNPAGYALIAETFFEAIVSRYEENAPSNTAGVAAGWR